MGCPRLRFDGRLRCRDWRLPSMSAAIKAARLHPIEALRFE
jgi:hypothetical protein